MELQSSNLPTALAGATGTAAERGLAGINGNDFMNILVKQLQYQDPFDPMKNDEMVSQISTIRELEMNTRLSRKLELLTDQQRFGAAAALIGRQVMGTMVDEAGTPFKTDGIVKAVHFTATGQAMLELDNGETLPLADLETVTESEKKPE